MACELCVPSVPYLSTLQHPRLRLRCTSPARTRAHLQASGGPPHLHTHNTRVDRKISDRSSPQVSEGDNMCGISRVSDGTHETDCYVCMRNRQSSKSAPQCLDGCHSSTFVPTACKGTAPNPGALPAYRARQASTIHCLRTVPRRQLNSASCHRAKRQRDFSAYVNAHLCWSPPLSCRLRR